MRPTLGEVDVPRVALLEIEYQLAITEAELRSVRQILDELDDGSLR